MTIEASIWVAVTTGLERRPAVRIRRFCRIGTSASGTSIPRSPRATMIPPFAAAAISSTFCAAWARSIFATSGMSEPRLRRRSFTGARSAAEETKETAMMSTPSLTAKSTQSRSDSVAAGSSAPPGMFIPLCELSVPPTSTSASTPLSRRSPTRRRIAPSAR